MVIARTRDEDATFPRRKSEGDEKRERSSCLSRY